jgi:hypothetical protein
MLRDPDPAFDFDVDLNPDQAFHSDADPDPASENDADPDPQNFNCRRWIFYFFSTGKMCDYKFIYKNTGNLLIR